MRALVIPIYSGSCFREANPKYLTTGKLPNEAPLWRSYDTADAKWWDDVPRVARECTGRWKAYRWIAEEEQRRLAEWERSGRNNTRYSSGGSSVLPDRCNEASRPQSVAIVRPAAVRAHKSGSTFLLGLLSGLRTEFLFRRSTVNPRECLPFPWHRKGARSNRRTGDVAEHVTAISVPREGHFRVMFPRISMWLSGHVNWISRDFGRSIFRETVSMDWCQVLRIRIEDLLGWTMFIDDF